MKNIKVQNANSYFSVKLCLLFKEKLQTKFSSPHHFHLVLGIKPSTLQMLGRCCTIELTTNQF
jgi:hypothetical protein